MWCQNSETFTPIWARPDARVSSGGHCPDFIWQEGLAYQSEADTFPRFEVSSSLGDQLDRVSVGTKAAMPQTTRSGRFTDVAKRTVVHPPGTFPDETAVPGFQTGDIVQTAGLTVYEPDDGTVHFARWTPLDQNAVSRSAVPPPAREDEVAGRGGSRRHDRAFWRGRGVIGRGGLLPWSTCNSRRRSTDRPLS